jgi:hypothetical protein
VAGHGSPAFARGYGEASTDIGLFRKIWQAATALLHPITIVGRPPRRTPTEIQVAAPTAPESVTPA